MRKLTLLITSLFLFVGMAWGANGDVLSLENGWYTFKANNSSGYAQYNGERIIIKAAYPLITEGDIAFYVTNGEDGKVTIQTADGKYVTYKGTGTGDLVEIVDATNANDGNKWWKIQEGKADNLRTIVPSTGATNGWNFAVYYNGANGALGFWGTSDDGSQWIIAQSVKVFAGKAKIKCHQSYLKWDNRTDGIIQKAASAEDATIFTISQNAYGYFAFQTPDGKFVTYDGDNNVTVANSSDKQWWKITANGGSGQGVDIFPSALTPGGGTNALNWSKNISGANTGLGTWRADDNNSYCSIEMLPVAKIGETSYYTFAEAAAAAQAGSEIKLLANIEGDITVPANVTFNGNGYTVGGVILAAGDITFAGVTKAADLDFDAYNTVVNIPAGASLQLNGSNRMSIGFGTTFNITGTIENAKTADKATLTPSLVIPGASFSGSAGVKFNVTNAYISVPSSYCSTSKTASGTFDFNITNSIWESAGKLAFEEQSVNAKVDFALVNSVLTTGSYLVFGTASGEEGVVIDNSYVNKDTSRQLENCGMMTIKNGSVVNGAVATSSNAKNPGTVIVENATYAVTGEFSGSDLGTGTLIIKKGANVSVGSIKAGANVTVDAEGMTAGDAINFTANLSQFTGTLSVINNDKLEAKIVDGKVVLAAKPVAKIGEQGYATLNEAFAAAAEGQTITMLDNATPALTSQRAITKAAVIDLGGKTMTLTEDDLYFGTTTFKNGTIVVDPSVNASTAVFWMFANQTLTFDNVKIVATGVTGTYLIGLDGNNSDLNLLNGSEILVENTTALDLDIICVNASTGNDIMVENSKVNVTNLDGRVFFRGNYTVAGNSEINLEGITKAGFRIEAGQTLSIEGTSEVNIEGEPRDGGIHLTDLTATYTKAETATVNATVNEPKVAKVGENTYRTLAQAVAAVEDGGTITLIANETFTKNNRYNNGGYWDGLGYSGDKSFTIDLGGFTIGQNGALNDYLMWFKNDGAKANTITLMNGTLDAGTTAYCALATASSNAQKITVNLENIKVINNNSNGATLKIRAGAELNVKAGAEITGKDSYLGIECWAATVNIYDGAKFYMNGTSSYNGCLAGASGNGTINVYGGEGLGKSGGFIAMTSGGTINIEGGEWTANTDGTYANGNKSVLVAQSDKQYNAGAGNSIVNVTGGTFKGGYNCYGNAVGDAQINIKGGTFNANPTSYVAEDYTAVENNGVWNVVKAAAKIGTTAYATFAEALSAVKGGETLTLLADLNMSEILVLDKAITLDGNGHKLTSTAGRAINVETEGNVGIKNLTINASGERAINVIQKPANVTIDNVTATADNYTVNVAASASAAVVAIKNSTLNGLCTVNVAAAGANVTVDNSTVNCNDNNTTAGESYAALCLNKAAVGGSIIATNTTVNVTEGSDSEKGRNGAENGTVTINGSTEGVTVTVAVITYPGSDNYHGFTSLADAIEFAEAGNTITLIRDVTIDELVKIDKAITLDLGGKKVTANCRKAFEVYANTTIKNGTIEALNRCVDTRKAVELTLTDVTLVADNYTTAYGNPQPLTIGGSENGTEVTMTNVNISAADGYGIITFVKTELTATNSTIGGYNALYVKPGSDNSVFDFIKSTLSGSTVGNDVEGNSFSTIAVRANNVTVNVDDASTVTAAGDYSYAISFISNFEGEDKTTGSSVTVAGGITGNILDAPNGNTVKVKAEYADELATAGYATIEAENGLVAVIEAVAKIVNTNYATFAEAVAAAQAGDEIVLLDNIALDATVTVAGKSITLDLNGKTVSGTCNKGQSSLVYVENNAALTVKDSSEPSTGKLTFAQGSSDVGWTVDVKGAFTLESGTIELTGSWSIGYAVDVRPNSWGTEYTKASVFTMNGGSIVSTDGGVRVASSSAAEHKAVAASFVMNGGLIDAAWDGVFVQQSDAIYDVLGFTMNGGTIKSALNPVRVYGPAATGYVKDQNCMSINFNGGEMTYTGTDAQTWAIEGILRVGGGSSLETVLASGNITASEAFAENHALAESLAEGYLLAKKDGMCVVGQLPDAEVVDLGLVTVGPDADDEPYQVDSYHVYDLIGGSGLSEGTESFDLQIAMNFKAKDTEEEARANAFAGYTTDFFIQMTGMSGDSFEANGCYLAGYYPSFKAWVKIPLDGFTVEKDAVYPVITSAGFDFKYTDICGSVKDFICGIYLTPEVLAANPGLNVKLSLGLSENMDAALAGTFTEVGSYTYDAEALMPAVAEVAGVGYKTLAKAIAAAEGDATITMLADVALTEGVTVPAGKTITLDLNGKTISANIAEQLTKSFAAITNKGTLTIKNGTITLSYDGDSFGYGVGLYTISNEGGTLNIVDAIIENTTTVSGSMYDAIDNNSTLGNTVLNISGGKVVCGQYIGVRQFANSTTYENIVNVTGGEVVGGNTSIWMQNPGSKQPKATIAISGDAKIEGRLLAGTSTGFVFAVTGGTFTTDVTSFCAKGYLCQANDNGTYSVVDDPSYEAVLNLVDGEFTDYNYGGVTVGKLTYQRTIPTTWTSFYVPFEVDVKQLAKQGFEVAYINGVRRDDTNYDGELDEFVMEIIYIHSQEEDKVDGSSKTLKANYPYFIRSYGNESIGLNIVLENAKLYAATDATYDCTTMTERFELIGNLSKVTIKASDDTALRYVVSGGKWSKRIEDSELNPFRFSMKLTSRKDSDPTIDAPAMMSIAIRGEQREDGTTLIYDVEMDEVESVDYIFDLQGRRVLEPKKGNLYIINGKKVIF